MKNFLLALTLLFGSALMAQTPVVGAGTTVPFAGVPSGSCTSNDTAINTTNGDFYDCYLGAWYIVTGGGGSGITGSTLVNGNAIKGTGAQTVGDSGVAFTNLVRKDAANTMGAFLTDFSAATMYLPSATTCSQTHLGQLCFDNTLFRATYGDGSATQIGVVRSELATLPSGAGIVVSDGATPPNFTTMTGSSSLTGVAGQGTKLQTSAKTITTITSVSSPYTVLSTDQYIECDGTGGAITINLPAASASGREIDVEKIDSSNACTIVANGTNTLNGVASVAMGTQYSIQRLVDVATGTPTTGNWRKIQLISASASLVGTTPLANGGTGSSAPYAVISKTSTYQVLAADFNNFKTIFVPSGTFTITLVDTATQPASELWIRVINGGTGTITIAVSGQNLNGATNSFILPPASSSNLPSTAWIESDGTDYVGSTSNPAQLRQTLSETVVANATSITPNSNNADAIVQSNTQALGTLTINADSGSPADESWMSFRIKSTNVQTLAWNSGAKGYAGGTVALPTATSGGTLTDYYFFKFSASANRWRFISSAVGF